MATLADRLTTVLSLIQQEQHLDAIDIYTPLANDASATSQKISSSSLPNPSAKKQLLAYTALHAANLAVITKLKNHAIKLHAAKKSLTENTDWTFAQTLFGISTYYRMEKDNTLSLKLEGELQGVPLFEQLCVLRETDLFHLWAPFVPRSRKLMQVRGACASLLFTHARGVPLLTTHTHTYTRVPQITKIELVSWFIISVPLFGLSRDAVFHAFGCDCMDKEGSVMIVAESVLSPDEFPSADIPPEPTGWTGGRMVLRSFSGLVEILSPTSAKTILIANVDPKIALPQKLLDFCMKKMAGVLLLYLQKMAKKVVSDPTCEHARKMREDPEFYKDYLLPKFEEYAKKRGWTLPPVAALAYNDPSSLASLSDSDDTASTRSSGSKNILGRAAHKVTKRLAQRRESKKERERIILLREAEDRVGKLSFISPSLSSKFEQWRETKDASGKKTIRDHLLEFPIWPLAYVYATSTLLESSAPVFSFVTCTALLYVLSFASAQSNVKRKRGTLSQTRNFGLFVVIMLTSFLSSAIVGAAWIYTRVERKASAVLRGHSLLSSDSLNYPSFGDEDAWGAMTVGRTRWMLNIVAILLGVTVFGFLIVVRNHKETAAVGIGQACFGAPSGGGGGGGGGAGRSSLPTSPLQEERTKRLAEKLKQRKLAASKNK